MSSSWIPWLLGGALAASLAWNLCPAPAAEPEPTAAPASIACCDLEQLQLSAAQSQELATCGAESADRGCRAGSSADAKLGELMAALRDPSAETEHLRQLAGEVSGLRARALQDCVDSIVAVRKVLTPEQLAALLDRCCVEGDCQKGAGQK